MRRAALSERSARAALTWLIDGGDPSVAALVDDLGALEVWARAERGDLGAVVAARVGRYEHEQIERLARHYKVRFVIPGDAEWPVQLDVLRHASTIQRRGGLPVGLWVRGNRDLAEISARSVAIVGSRAASAYGLDAAAQLAAELTDAGYAVISGGAFGIDAAAHTAALHADGRTIAVLACGVDVPYPRGNALLLDKVVRSGICVSELPPGQHPTRIRFLARNRLIAALSSGTVIVEAALRSGARNTAGWSTECGRPLMAVPGSINSALSQGPHLLIRSGQAALVTSAAQVLELVSPMGQGMLLMVQGELRETDRLSESALAVFEALKARSWSDAGEVAIRAHVSMPLCLAELAELERLGLAEAGSGGWRVARQVARGGPRPPQQLPDQPPKDCIRSVG